MADREPDIQLGQFTERAEEYVSRGVYDSIEDVVAEAMDALDERERAITAILREKSLRRWPIPGRAFRWRKRLADFALLRMPDIKVVWQVIVMPLAEADLRDLTEVHVLRVLRAERDLRDLAL